MKNHDYLVSDAYEFCHAVRKQGSDKWEQFGKRKKFNKAWRRFEVLNESMPKEFVQPYMSNPWDSKSYNSLEAFM